MNRIAALAGVMAGCLALAACGTGADDAGQDNASQPRQATPDTSPLAGTYGASGSDGQPWTSTLNADGTYRNTVAGQLSQAGRWTHREDQLCFLPEAAAGEAAAQVCLKVLNVNDDGSLVLADTEGTQTTAPRLQG